MNKYSYLAVLCFFISCVFFFIAFVNDELTIGIAFIIPFVMSSGLYGFLAIIFLISSFFIFSFGSFFHNAQDPYAKRDDAYLSDMESKHQNHSKMKAGGLIMIGPIPIVFGTSKKITISLLAVAIIFIVIFYFLLK